MIVANVRSTPRLLPLSPAEPITSGMPRLRESVRNSSSSSRDEMAELDILAEINGPGIGAAAVGDHYVGTAVERQAKAFEAGRRCPEMTGRDHHPERWISVHAAPPVRRPVALMSIRRRHLGCRGAGRIAGSRRCRCRRRCRSRGCDRC